MEYQQYHHLKDLEEAMNSQHKIRVRVSRIWNHYLPNWTIAGINIILVDEFNGRIHAWLNSAFFKRLRDFFVEGKTIVIQNFVVRKYRQGVTNKCFKNDNHISLTNTSIITPADVPSSTIPDHMFDFVPLENIYQYGFDHEHLIDVIGNIELVHPLHEVKDTYSRIHSFIIFTIADGSAFNVRVCFTGEMAKSFSRNVSLQKEPRGVIIISSCKVNVHNGICTMSNMAATRYFINPEHPAALSMLSG